jgi:V8-like Glu-specific endopeptidase
MHNFAPVVLLVGLTFSPGVTFAESRFDVPALRADSSRASVERRSNSYGNCTWPGPREGWEMLRMDPWELKHMVQNMTVPNSLVPNGSWVETDPKSRPWNTTSAQHLLRLGVPRAVLFRQVLTNEQSYPWRTVGKVYVGQNLNFDSWIWSGSGVLVGPNLLLTASHVLPWGRSGWWMRFIPAYNFGAEPFGSSYVAQCRGVINTDDVTGLDFAICRLYTRLGDTIGWMGSYASTDDDAYEDRRWTSVGYPGDTQGGQVPTVEENVEIVDIDGDGDGKELESGVYGSKGWSGGPLWGFIGGDAKVVGVMSGKEEEFDFFSFFTATHTVNAGGFAMVNLVKYGHANWV